jgi:hypothetical protein
MIIFLKENKKKLIFYTFIHLILFLYIYYRNKFFFDNYSNFYKTYYYLIIANYLIIISLLYFNYNFYLYYFISLLSLIAALYIFEFYLFKNSMLLNEKKTRIEVFEKNLNSISNLSLSGHTTQIGEYYALSNIPNSKTIGCNENGYVSINYTDRYGFANNDENWNYKKINSILVGDSFVWGDCVNDEDTFVGVMNKIENKINISLGMPGNGPLKNLATLKEFYPKNKQIDKIFFFFYEGNDISDFKEEYKNSILKKYLNEGFVQGLKNNKIKNYIKEKQRNAIIKNYNLKKKTNYERYTFISFVKLQKTRHKLKRIELHKKNYDVNTIIQLKKTLLELKNFSIKNKSDLYIVYLPQYYRYKKFYFFYDYKNLISNISNELKIKFIDIDKMIFQKHNDPLNYFPYRAYGHYTPKANALIANLLAKY